MPVLIAPEGGTVQVVSPGWAQTVTSGAGSVMVTQGAHRAEVVSESHSVNACTTSGLVEVKSGVMVGGTPYQGAYEASALFSEQVFPTALKTMSRDFTVHAINYTEAPNEYGTTLTIGG